MTLHPSRRPLPSNAPPRWRMMGVWAACALSGVVGANAWTQTEATPRSLLEAHALARQQDPAYQSAQAQVEASLARVEQARAGLLPSVGLGASITRNHVVNSLGTQPPKTTSIDYTVQNAAINGSQPLFRPVNWATFDQSKKSADLIGAQLLGVDQDLIVRVSQTYFDVLAAQETLAFLGTQKQAVAQQLAAAKRNFEVGTATVTDSREAQARYDLVLAQEIAAENDLRLKQLLLDQAVGLPGTRPFALAQPVRLPELKPNTLAPWVQQALANSSAVQQADLALQVAKLETKKARYAQWPTLDLTASVGATGYPEGNPAAASYPSGSNLTNTAVGLSLNVPLFAGFAMVNRVRETLALENKAAADLDIARRNVAQAVQNAFYGVQSGEAQVKALEAAEASSQSALDANLLGYKVGVRINIDVLNSQSQLYQTKRDLAKARLDVLLAHLKLRQAAGVLVANDLQPINAMLKPPLR